MIPARALADALGSRGWRFFSGVPCSYLGGLIDVVGRDDRFRYVPAANEGAALAVAAGAWLSGRRAAVLLQNSGLGNLVNPLASLNAVYDIPALLVVSLRAYPDPDLDEPQHRVMGSRTASILDLLGVPHAMLPPDAGQLGPVLDEADAAGAAGRCFALLVRRGAIEGRAGPAAPRGWPMSRLDAIRVVAGGLPAQAAVVATTGMTSRELMLVEDRSRNFYMAGSMGHAMGIGLGVALGQPERKVVILDGDGAVLMHMGTLSSIGHLAPANLVHVVLDNEAYGSTGDQSTTSSSTDLPAVARACGYRHAWRCREAHELSQALSVALGESGPALVVAKIDTAVAQAAPRVTAGHGLASMAARFRDAIQAGGVEDGRLT